MTDLISRQAVNDALERTCDLVCQYSKKQRSVMCGACPLGSAFDAITEIPTIDSVKHGKWTEQKVTHEVNRRSTIIADWQSAKCSNCGRYHTTPYTYYFYHYNYCPWCGAKMETSGRYFVRCSKCDIAQENLWATKQTAIKRWNRRVKDEF